MAPKSKKTPIVVEEPATKKAKVASSKEEPKKEEPNKEEPKKEEPKVDEEGEKKFEEPDAPKDSRSLVKETVAFTTSDSTLNVVPTMGGSLLTAISEGAMSFLLAGARANVGMKSGRYMFEARIIQNLGVSNDNKSKPMLKIGISTAGSSLFLGEDEKSVCFDSDGGFTADKKRINLSQKARFGKEKTVAVVLNLDHKSPNANTINLYVDGEKIAEPRPLPDSLKGEPLFPTVTYRNLSVQMNFGTAPLKDLPFKCRMLQGAANSDVSVVASREPKDGKYEVVLPVAFPDEGTFDWLDGFLEKNPRYMELSDRKIAAWCKSSGMASKGASSASNDRPVNNYGVQGLDDFSVRRVINSIAPCVPRHYVIMEVKANLLASDRQACLKKFNYPCFKKIAHVVMGKPSEEYKQVVQSKILKDKQAKADAAWKAKKDIEARKKAHEKKQKELAKQRSKKKTEKKDDEPMDDKQEVEEVQEDAEEQETEPPAVELTEEEKQTVFYPRNTPDLAASVLSANFGKFTTPQRDEGFDDIRYEWENSANSDAYLKNWVLNKKLTTRIDTLQPGKFFKDKVAEFEKVYKEWQDKQIAAKKPAKKATDEMEDEPDIDLFSVADVCDVGDGLPLFGKFAAEDWELVKLRFEFAILIASFKKDCDDPDREGIPLEHLSFYYQRYFKKNVNFKMYCLAEEKEIFSLIKDTVTPKDAMLVSQLADVDCPDIFVKLTEEHRRERQRRLDAGDETARLKFIPPKVIEKPKLEAKKQEAKVVAPKLVPAPRKAKGKGESSPSEP